jgi:hypothetical protein
MLQSLPQEKQWVSWLYVIIWSLIIFVTIPLARAIQRFVYQQWSREVFTYVVLAVIVIALVAAIQYIIRHRPTSRSSYFWLLAVAAIFVGYTIELGKKSPEEAIHFIQYGVLGILVYRALIHRIHDVSIYFAAAIICGIIGTIDEVIQWLTPKRFWGFRDIWINFFAAFLVQIAIAKGLKPQFIANRLSRINLLFLCRLAIVATALIGACLMNTPDRIAWYAERIPWLGFLRENESVMAEYGYLYNDPDIGIFRSRLSPDELKIADLKRATKAAAILNIYRDRPGYQEFLSIYTPVTDPFLHEARVHLFSRDANFLIATEYEGNSEIFARHLTTAYRENQIMEKYFPHTQSHSDYVWSPHELNLSRKHLLRNKVFESWVSRHLITSMSEVQIGSFFLLLVLGLSLLYWYLTKYNPQ